MTFFWEGQSKEELVEAAEAAERMGRDVSARQTVNDTIKAAVRQVRILLREYGEMPDQWMERVEQVQREIVAGGYIEVATRNAAAFAVIGITYRIMEPVAKWTGEMLFGQPHMTCDEKTCLWDCYQISYSLILREAVILTVVRNLTKEQAENVYFQSKWW